MESIFFDGQNRFYTSTGTGTGTGTGRPSLNMHLRDPKNDQSAQST
jgi:hypothetical protein